MQLLILVALCAPLAALQSTRAVPTPAQGPAVNLLARYHELVELARPAPGPLGLRAAATSADVFGEMAALADAGLGPARAWCARHLGDAPAETALTPAAAGDYFVRLALDHGGEPWMVDPALDPLRSLELAAHPVRKAVDTALQAETGQEGEKRALALALRAVALAPRSGPDDERRARSLSLLDELLERFPESILAPRAALLAWRIEHLSPGQQAPELVAVDVDGNQLRLSHLRGRVLLVDVWTSRGEDLLANHAARRALLARYPKRSLEILGIGHGVADALAFRRLLEELDPTWPVAYEPDSLGPATLAWHLDGAPTTFLLDERGVVRAVGLTGADLDAMVERLLALPDCGGNPAAPAVDEGTGLGSDH